MFNFFKKKDTESKTAPDRNATVKGVYILAITSEKLPPDVLKTVIKLANDMLTKKNPIFARIWGQQMPPSTPIEISNILYAGSLMHTPQTMQTALKGWVEKQYNVKFNPEVNQNFFPHGMRDPKGKENFFLYYFDFAG